MHTLKNLHCSQGHISLFHYFLSPDSYWFSILPFFFTFPYLTFNSLFGQHSSHWFWTTYDETNLHVSTIILVSLLFTFSCDDDAPANYRNWIYEL